MLEAFWEDDVGNAAVSVSKREQRCHLGLEVSGYARIGLSNHICGMNSSGMGYIKSVMVIRGAGIQRGNLGEVYTCAMKPLDKREHLGCGGLPDGYPAACDGGGDGEGGGFDPVRTDGVLSRFQCCYTMDLDRSGLREMNMSTGAGEEGGEFCNFWFLSGIEDTSGAGGERGGGKDIAGAGYCGAGGTGEVNSGTMEFTGDCMDEAVCNVDVGAERRESCEVEVDWSGADAAATWKWDHGLTVASNEGTEQADAGAHAADEQRVSGTRWVLRWLNCDLG